MEISAININVSSWKYKLVVSSFTNYSSVSLLMDERLMLVIAWEVNINGVLLSWAVTLDSSAEPH